MKFEGLIGQNLHSIVQKDDELIFVAVTGRIFRMYHGQGEDVHIESISGDLMDLIGRPIEVAEEASNRDSRDPEKEGGESFTWTFYKLATRAGWVDIRWFGTSNGYYAEGVDFEEVHKPWRSDFVEMARFLQTSPKDVWATELTNLVHWMLNQGYLEAVPGVHKALRVALTGKGKLAQAELLKGAH